VETGVQVFWKSLKTLDSGFRRNDTKRHFLTFYEIIKFALLSLLRKQESMIMGQH